MNRARTLALSGIALLALLALVAVASRTHRPGGSSGSVHTGAPIGDYALTLALVLAPIGPLILIYAFLFRRGKPYQEPITWRGVLSTLALMALAFVLARAVISHVHWQGRARTVHQTVTNQRATAPPPSRLRARREHPFEFQWIVPAVVGGAAAMLVLALGIRAHRRRGRRARGERAALTEALDEVLAGTLDDLRAERDPRRAVIRAYARMERTFHAHGVPRRPAETPLEYVARVLGVLNVSAFSVRRLTELFERARFSRHWIDETMKEQAIDALAGVRAELEAEAEAAA